VAEQTLAIMRARNRAFRWPKGTSGNPSGQAAVYHQCRKLARDASPAMMEELIRLAQHADDERVRSVCLIAVLDRAGIRPIEKPIEDDDGKPQAARFRAEDYSEEELERIEAALLLLTDPTRARAERGERSIEVLPPATRMAVNER
jgi:hypothetical protein